MEVKLKFGFSISSFSEVSVKQSWIFNTLKKATVVAETLKVFYYTLFIAFEPKKNINTFTIKRWKPYQRFSYLSTQVYLCIHLFNLIKEDLQ